MNDELLSSWLSFIVAAFRVHRSAFSLCPAVAIASDILAAHSKEYLETILTGKYRAAGFEVLETGTMDEAAWSQLQTSWARRLQGNTRREVVYLMARAAPAEGSALASDPCGL